MPLQAQSPIDFIIDRLRHDPAGLGKIAALGPQTNIATSLIRAPDIVTRAEEIIIMGGAYFEVGNTRPTTAA